MSWSVARVNEILTGDASSISKAEHVGRWQSALTRTSNRGAQLQLGMSLGEVLVASRACARCTSPGSLVSLTARVVGANEAPAKPQAMKRTHRREVTEGAGEKDGRKPLRMGVYVRIVCGGAFRGFARAHSSF
jgi:hypothetical protein